MSFCPKKYIPSAKTLYSVDLSNVTFGYLCADSPNYLRHFESYFSQQKASVSFQLKYYILSTKVIHQSEDFQTFPLLRLKFTKFLMSFFKQKVSFYSKFRSSFSSMRDNSSVLFKLKLYMLLTKVAHQLQISRLATTRMNQIPYVIFQPTSQFLFKLCNTLQCQDT